MPFLYILVSAALLWICYVTVTKEYRIHWMKMLIWVIIARLVPLAFSLLLFAKEMGHFGMLIQMVDGIIYYGILFLVLRFVFYEKLKTSLQIMGLFIMADLAFQFFFG